MIIYPGWISPGKTTITIYQTFIGIWAGSEITTAAIMLLRVALSAKQPSIRFTRVA